MACAGNSTAGPRPGASPVPQRQPTREQLAAVLGRLAFLKLSLRPAECWFLQDVLCSVGLGTGGSVGTMSPVVPRLRRALWELDAENDSWLLLDDSMHPISDPGRGFRLASVLSRLLAEGRPGAKRKCWATSMQDCHLWDPERLLGPQSPPAFQLPVVSSENAAETRPAFVRPTDSRLE